MSDINRPFHNYVLEYGATRLRAALRIAPFHRKQAFLHQVYLRHLTNPEAMAICRIKLKAHRQMEAVWLYLLATMGRNPVCAEA